ncbi:MAG: helix-turn-helix domain-containing protein [Cyclobacteriaceae bacterium]
MKIEKIAVSSLDEIIHSVWFISIEKEKITEGYYFFPDNHAEIIVSFKGLFHRSIIGSTRKSAIAPGEGLFTRTRSRGMVLTGDEEVRLLIIKLHPQYQCILCNDRTYKFKEDIQKFSLPTLYQHSWKKAIVNNNPNELISIFETYLTEQSFLGHKRVDSLIEETISLIKQNKGEIKVKDLYSMFGISKSTLEQKFNREVGLSPKEFCKIEKLNNFLKNYEEFKHDMSLTQLTFKSGYYDQSHLIKDFKYYVDESPKKFLTQANRISLIS